MLHWILPKYFFISCLSAQVTNRHTGMQTFCSFSHCSDCKKHRSEISGGGRKDVTLAAQDTSGSDTESKSISCIPATHKWINTQTLQTNVPWKMQNMSCATLAAFVPHSHCRHTCLTGQAQTHLRHIQIELVTTGTRKVSAASATVKFKTIYKAVAGWFPTERSRALNIWPFPSFKTAQ